MKKRGDKNIWLLGSSSLFNDIGSEMITPVLPFYITSLGGGGVAVGLLSGMREGFSSLLKILGGWFSDKIGKRRSLVFFGYCISVVLKLLLGLASSWQQLVTFVSLERFGKLRDAPRDAIIADSTNERGRGFGIHQMLDSAGAIIGTILVVLLFWKFSHDFKTIVFIGAAISVFSLIPIFFVKEQRSKKTNKNLFQGVRTLNKKLKYFIFVSAIFSLANFGIYLFFLLQAQKITGSIIIALLLYVLFNVSYTVATEPSGKLSDKVGRKKVLLFAYILFFFVAVGFSYFSSVPALAFLFAFYGIVFAITEPTQKAMVADFAEDTKGTALGFYHFTRGITTIVAGIAAGIVWNLNPAAMFYSSAAISLFAVIFLIMVKEKNRR